MAERITVRLGDVADVKWGDTSTTKSSYVSHGFLAFSASGPDGALSHADYDETGIVVSAIGAQCGRSWLARGKWSCIKNTIRILGRSDSLDVEYLYWILSATEPWAKRGSAQPFISQTDARDVRVKLPPLAEQQAIAEVLGALDDKIACNSTKARLSYELLQSTWQQAAGGAAEFVAFGDVADIDKGLSYKGSGLGSGVPLVNLANFGVDGRFHVDALKYYSGEVRERHWVRRGDLVLANTDLTQRREILGQPALVDIERERALFSHHVYAVRLHAKEYDGGLLLWLYAALRDASFRDRATTYATGTTVAALPRDALLTYDVPWPDATERRRWCSITQDLVDTASLATRENRTVALMRDTLLPRLLSGELRVRNAEALVEGAV